MMFRRVSPRVPSKSNIMSRTVPIVVFITPQIYVKRAKTIIFAHSNPTFIQYKAK